MFPDEGACLRYVLESRWPGGAIECPRCAAARSYPREDRRAGRECADCGHTFSATSGTVMDHTRLPLSLWLQSAYLLVTDKRGLSAKQLQRDLGLRGYETAWGVLQKLRAAMVNPDRTRLTGRVEVDESYIGGPEPGKRGRGADGKFLVVGGVEVRIRTHPGTGAISRYPGRVRLRHIGNAIQPDLVDFVLETVADSSTIVTDGFEAYRILPEFGYAHEVESVAQGMKQDAVLRHYHLAISNLKTWLAGTFHGAVGRASPGGTRGKHLQGYLNEFAFRFNRRHDLFSAFRTVLGIAARARGPTREALYDSGPQRFVHVRERAPRFRRKR